MPNNRNTALKSSEAKKKKKKLNSSKDLSFQQHHTGSKETRSRLPEKTHFIELKSMTFEKKKLTFRITPVLAHTLAMTLTR